MGLSATPPRFVSSSLLGRHPLPSLPTSPSSMDTTTDAATAGGGGSGGGGSEEEDQTRMAAITEKLQTRDAMRLYGWLSQRCFSDCVTTFYRKALGKREGDCVRACVHKYLLVTTASSARFAELADPAASAAATDDD